MSKHRVTASPRNKTLSSAKTAKQDEFYTQLADIENELKYYREQLFGKVIFCNCDDPYESNFFRYFALNFNLLGLKKIIATSYNGSRIAGGLLSPKEMAGLKPDGKKPYAIEINEVPDANNDGAIDLSDVEWLLKNNNNTCRTLVGDGQFGAGDFRSASCVEYLEQADIVVTNPPFSLFREYVAQLVKHEKLFTIIGNKNAVTYKDVTGLIRNNLLWIGMTSMSKDLLFDVPTSIKSKLIESGKEGSSYKIVNGVVKGRSTSCWFTNINIKKRDEILPLFVKYEPENFPEFDNYYAINVNETAKIPFDYDKAMAVPISFLDKYSPNQFEILNCNDFRKSESVPIKDHGLIKDKDSSINGKPTYVRLVIRRKF